MSKRMTQALHQGSNNTYRRILESLPPEVARSYGCTESHTDPRKLEFDQALAAQNWERAALLSAELAKNQSC